MTEFRRARGRQKGRWEEQGLEDTKTIRIHNWRGKIQDQESWKRITKEEKTSETLEYERGKCDVTHHELRVLELELSGCYPTRGV